MDKRFIIVQDGDKYNLVHMPLFPATIAYGMNVVWAKRIAEALDDAYDKEEARIKDSTGKTA